jgi:hypothetical protein
MTLIVSICLGRCSSNGAMAETGEDAGTMFHSYCEASPSREPNLQRGLAARSISRTGFVPELLPRPAQSRAGGVLEPQCPGYGGLVASR